MGDADTGGLRIHAADVFVDELRLVTSGGNTGGLRNQSRHGTRLLVGLPTGYTNLATRFTHGWQFIALKAGMLYAQYVRSSVRYWMASAMCFGWIAGSDSRSATVLATFKIR